MFELFNPPMQCLFAEEVELRRLRERECGFLPPGARTRVGRFPRLLLLLLLALFVS
jgi:hypothetical protein